MRNCYDSLLSAAAATTNSVYGWLFISIVSLIVYLIEISLLGMIGLCYVPLSSTVFFSIVSISVVFS